MLSIPGKVLEIVDEQRHLARVEVEGVIRNVNTGPVDDVAVGDWILVYLDMAVSKLDEQEAQETLKFLRDLAKASEEGP